MFLHSYRNIIKLVDGVILIGSEFSNFGERSYLPGFWHSPSGPESFKFEPDLKLSPQENERAKRNYGLQRARESGYTHFIMMDADEFYEAEPFLKEKERFKNPDLLGLVCGLKCYFKSPNLSAPDGTLVPFIHKITPQLKFEWNTRYPFAFEGFKRDIRIDPTRQMNINNGVEWSEITMHHMSWVRKDIQKKIRNSTARVNIEKSTIVQDYLNAAPGYYCEFYKSKLVACENIFNIPDITDESAGSEFTTPGGHSVTN